MRFTVGAMAAASKGIAVLVLLLAALVLFGYWQGLLALIAVMPGLQGMSPLTATGLAGIALTLLVGDTTTSSRRAGAASAATVIAIATLVLLNHLLFGQDRVSPRVAAAVFGFAPGGSGKTSVATALCLLLSGTAHVLHLRGRTVAAARLAGLTLCLAGSALLGYAYGVEALYGFYLFNSMALHTATALFLLALAYFLRQPDGKLASVLASVRAESGETRSLLAFALLPPLAGWLLLYLTRTLGIGDAMAMALVVMLTIVPLVVLLLHNVHSLEKLAAERLAKTSLQDELTRDLGRQLADQAQMLAEQNREREHANLLLERAKRIEAVAQLTGGIAHDFNNLLMIISGSLQLLKLQQANPERAEHHIGKALTTVDKAAKLTAQLLAFSRIQRLNTKPMQLDRLLRGVLERVRHVVGPAIHVDMVLAADAAWIEVDADQLESAILNVAQNARDAMPDGGTLTLATSIDYQRSAGAGADVTLAISDSGAGMADEVLRRACEPFFTTKPHSNSIGLGLAQVQAVVQQCSGELHMVSAPGQGTRVEMRFLCIAAVPVPAVGMTPAGGPLNSRQPLLVVDDDDDVRAVVVEMLRHMGYEVVEARDGESGLRLLDSAAPALAIIDFLMPGMNGAEVARQARLRTPNLPIIFISGYGDTDAMEAIPNAGLLRKPVAAAQLNASVVQALGERR